MVTATGSNEPLDAAYCELVRDTYGLTMPVLFDPDGVTQSVLDMRVNGGEMVLIEGNVISFNAGPAHTTVAGLLADLYGH